VRACKHKWIGDTCCECGIAHNIYQSDHIATLEHALGECVKALESACVISNNPKFMPEYILCVNKVVENAIILANKALKGEK
jgi:hypothetical protein